MSGGLVLVPEAAVTAVPEMKVDDLLKIYVSLGALTPEVMPGAIAAAQPVPPMSEPQEVTLDRAALRKCTSAFDGETRRDRQAALKRIIPTLSRKRAHSSVGRAADS